MIFIETRIFTQLVGDYLSEQEYQELQNHLIGHPSAGDLMQGTGGIRKIRWFSGNKGKRGGVRVIYYWHTAHQHIYLMTLYAKNEMSDLTENEKKVLKKMVEGLAS